jgi:hypothetical protein
MLIRAASLALVLLAALFVSAPARAGAIMSVNHVSVDDLPLDECLTRARAAIREAGYRYHDKTESAIWGTAADRRDMVVVYCLKGKNIVVFVAASPTGRGSVTERLVNDLVDAWERVR